MSPGSHAANDGSFARSTSIQAGRAALLIGAALAIGLILLHRPGVGGPTVAIGGTTDTSVTLPQTSSSVATGGSSPGTTARASGTTSTTPSAARAPQDIKVLVANGTSTPGLAATVSNQVHAKGYGTLASTNSSQKPASTVIYFAPSYSNDAAALAAKFNLAPTAVQAMPSPPPVTNLNGANILLIVGPDLATAKSTTSST